MRANTNRGPAEVVLAKIDRVERRVPGFGASTKNICLGDRVIVQSKLGDKVLGVADVLYALVLLVPRFSDEENIFVGAVDLAEGRDEACLVAVADVVLAAACEVGAIDLWIKRHLRGVDVGAVLFFRQTECEDRAVSQHLRSLLLDRFVVRNPDWTETEHAHLPGIPIGEAIKAENLVEFTVTPAVPADVLGAACKSLRRHQLGEDLLTPDELEKIGVPDTLVIVILDAAPTLVLEELDGLAHDLDRCVVLIMPTVLVRIEQHKSPMRQRRSGKAALSMAVCRGMPQAAGTGHGRHSDRLRMSATGQ